MFVASFCERASEGKGTTIEKERGRRKEKEERRIQKEE
jgi:hypothetical protein